MKKLFASLFIAVTLAMLAGSGCSNSPTTEVSTPVFDITKAQRDVFAAKEGYGVAVRLATAYAEVSRCKVPAVLPCSDPAVIAQITKARNVARDSLAAAQTAVDTPGFGSDVISTALTAMKSGLSAFQSISNKYGTK